MKSSIISKIVSAASASIGLVLLSGCADEIDNAYTRFPSVIEISASAPEVILNDDTPDEVALTLYCSSGPDYGGNYDPYYILTGTPDFSSGDKTESTTGGEVKTVYEYLYYGDSYVREYTHAELQKMMTEDFSYLTSTWGAVDFTLEMDTRKLTDGAPEVLPDENHVTVRIKTSGARQFAADRVFIAGTAIGDTQVELAASSSDPDLYVYNGELAAGSFNFPVINGDENNFFVPASGTDETLANRATSTATAVADDEERFSWNIEQTGSYRITLDMETAEVSLKASAEVIENVDRVVLFGTVLPEGEAEFARTLEDPAKYAWYGHLDPGFFNLPVEYRDIRSVVMVPENAQEHGFTDGVEGRLTTVAASAVNGRYWSIEDAGYYRIVVDTESPSVTIYSEATDVKPKTVIFKRTEGGVIDPFTCEVEQLYILGDAKYYEGSRPAGEPYVLHRSIANPRLFVYSGEELQADRIKFSVTDHWNNEYAYGSGDVSGNLSVEIGRKVEGLYGGQGENRNARFSMPAGVNYIEVYIGDESTDENEHALGKCWQFKGSYVIFDKR